MRKLRLGLRLLKVLGLSKRRKSWVGLFWTLDLSFVGFLCNSILLFDIFCLKICCCSLDCWDSKEEWYTRFPRVRKLNKRWLWPGSVRRLSVCLWISFLWICWRKFELMRLGSWKFSLCIYINLDDGKPK